MLGGKRSYEVVRSASHSSLGHGSQQAHAIRRRSSSGLVGGGAVRYGTVLFEYLARLARPSQMDLEFACSQMVELCRSPEAVYRSTQVRKQIKNQWARDDPAFVAILLCFMTVSAVAYSIAFGWSSPLHFVRLVGGAVLLDFLGMGMAVATLGWWLANHHLRMRHTSVNVDQRVEWLYAFDVHCNAFFPVFLILYVIQFFLSPFLIGESYAALIVANSLYATAFCYYHYVSFLGYNALPFLKDTERFLLPIPLSLAFCIICLISRINLSRVVLHWYFGR